MALISRDYPGARQYGTVHVRIVWNWRELEDIVNELRAVMGSVSKLVAITTLKTVLE
jgi:hypothetical protein